MAAADHGRALAASALASACSRFRAVAAMKGILAWSRFSLDGYNSLEVLKGRCGRIEARFHVRCLYRVALGFYGRYVAEALARLRSSSSKAYVPPPQALQLRRSTDEQPPKQEAAALPDYVAQGLDALSSSSASSQPAASVRRSLPLSRTVYLHR
jgi:hypothetical protein